MKNLQISGEIFDVDEHRILFHVQIVPSQKSLDERLVQSCDSRVQVVRHHLKLGDV